MVEGSEIIDLYSACSISQHSNKMGLGPDERYRSCIKRLNVVHQQEKSLISIADRNKGFSHHSTAVLGSGKVQELNRKSVS